MRNWDKYQSPARQSGWRPPWCKLYWKAWDDFAYCQLSLEERGLLSEMYRLATKHGNELTNDAQQIAHEIRVEDVGSVRNGLNRLMSTGFLQRDDNLSSLEVEVEVFSGDKQASTSKLASELGAKGWFRGRRRSA